MLFDIRIDESTYQVIHDRSEELYKFSATMESWETTPWSSTLLMVNSETLSILRRHWLHYFTADISSAAVTKSYNEVIGRIYLRHHKSRRDGELHTEAAKKFWEACTVNGESHRLFNPLFTLSDTSGSGFAVHHDTSPFAGFHLATSVSKLTPDSLYYPGHGDCGTLKDAVNFAEMQWDSWCMAFVNTLHSSTHKDALRIRFFVGDAIALCMALHELRVPVDIAICYSRPGSARPLKLNGNDYLSNSKTPAPKVFNAIDTSYLVDHVGILNVLPHVVRALQSTTSVLYTSTRAKSISDELNLLGNLLCAKEISTMCVFFGVVPSAYVSGLTTRTYQPYRSHLPASLDNRITWRLNRAGDRIINYNASTPACDAEQLAKFVCRENVLP